MHPSPSEEFEDADLLHCAHSCLEELLLLLAVYQPQPLHDLFHHAGILFKDAVIVNKCRHLAVVLHVLYDKAVIEFLLVQGERSFAVVTFLADSAHRSMPRIVNPRFMTRAAASPATITPSPYS